MITIKSLAGFSQDELYQAFEQAFIDYEIHINQVTFGNMMIRRGFRADLSFGAFDEDRLVSFTLNGAGTFRGIKTAYDTGTGTIREYRGQGLAKRIFEYSIPFLKKAGLIQYLLEVIHHNVKAFALYKKMGFQVTRELHYFVNSRKELQLKPGMLKPEYELIKTSLPLPSLARKFEDAVSSWQNSWESIDRCPDHFEAIAAHFRSKMAGYCIFETSSGDISKLVVSAPYRRKGLGTLMLHYALEHIIADKIKILNVPEKSEDVIKFLKFHGIKSSGKQYEMVRKL